MLKGDPSGLLLYLNITAANLQVITAAGLQVIAAAGLQTTPP